MSSDFSTTVKQALAAKRIAGGAAIAIDDTGRTIIHKQFGKISTEDNARPFTFDTTFWIASSSKLLTSISALQCVEKGLLKLDDDIGDILPEWKDPDILTGFDESNKPIHIKAKNRITLRRLLTHSSGMTYGEMYPLLVQYRKTVLNKEPDADIGMLTRHKNPLICEPGSSWNYGPSIDWAGHLVEVVTGLTLGSYMTKHIFDPLGMTSTTFEPLSNPDIMAHMTGRVGRDAITGLVGPETFGLCQVRNPQDHLGGEGLYSCANDYITVLTSLLLDDGKLLAKSGEMYKSLFTPQLENPSAFHSWATNPIMGAYFAPGLPQDPTTTEWDYGLGGALVMKEPSGQAGRGTLFWSGYANNYWFVDQENGVAGYYGNWILPAGDAVTGQMFRALQTAAAKEVAGSK